MTVPKNTSKSSTPNKTATATATANKTATRSRTEQERLESKSTPSKSATKSKTDQERLEQENQELKNTLKQINEKLEHLLAENTKLREENAVLRELREENAVLSKRIDTLELSQIEKESTSPPPPPSKAPPVSDKQHYEVLILSDSMLRHVMGDCPKKSEEIKLKSAKKELPFHERKICQQALEQDIPFKVDNSPNPRTNRRPIGIKKIVIPGARAPRLLSEAIHLAGSYSFEHVIVHVGTNYVPYASTDQAVSDINGLLDQLPYLFPGCRVTYSPILPRTTPEGKRFPTMDDLLEAIREINASVDEHCNQKMYTVLTCEDFTAEHSDMPIARRHLLAKDGCHLNRKGIVAMDHALHDYINTLFGIFRH